MSTGPGDTVAAFVISAIVAPSEPRSANSRRAASMTVRRAAA
ncbi:MAG: hypothetical protein ACOC20_00190 [Oceanicaulis sp.]